MIAVRHGERQISFADLEMYASRLANALLDLGLRTGDQVHVQVPLCLELAVIEYALEKAQLVKVGLAASVSPWELKTDAAHRRALALVIDSASCGQEKAKSWRDLFDVLICIGAPMEGCLVYEELVRQCEALPVIDCRLKRDALPADPGMTCRVAMVGPFANPASMLMLPHLHAGNSLVLFDRLPESGLRGIMEESATHVFMEIEALGAWTGARTSQDASGAPGASEGQGKSSLDGHDKAQAHADLTEEQVCAAIESTLCRHPAVLEACAVRMGQKEWHAVVALHPGARASAAELIDYCCLNSVEQPCLASLAFFAELPKNASGNLARKLIREQYRQAYRLPR